MEASKKRKEGTEMKTRLVENEITYIHKCMQTGAELYATTYPPKGIASFIMEKGILAGPPFLIMVKSCTKGLPLDMGEEE